MIFPPAVSGSSAAYEIEKSVRFRASVSPSLSRTPSSAGNRKKLAMRFRVKRGALGALQVIASAGTASIDRFYFDASNRLCLDVLGTSRLVTTPVFRDPSAWYVDVGFEIDVANGTAASRAKILIDGTEVSTYSTDTRSSITNTDTNWNNTVVHYIGRDNAGNYFDGYLSEPVLADGSTSIIYSNTGQNGVRDPLMPSASYGTNGSYLPFSNGTSLSTLTADASGNGNNWTANNISLTAGVNYDWMDDTPTNNHTVLNPLVAGAANITKANLASGTTAVRGTFNALAINSYWEVTAGGSNVTAGVVNYDGTTNTVTVTANKVFAFRLSTAGALDYRNVTDAGSWTSITTGLSGNQFPYGTTAAADWNFGQRPFSGTVSAGYAKLCTANLPAPTIAKPSDHFDVKLYVGNGSTQSITGLDFQPDLVWMKSRGRAVDHAWYDSVRGVQKQLESNTTGAETTETTGLTAFNSDGWTMGALDQINGTTATNAYVGWAWKANGAPVTNTAGTITSQVSANTTAGFSIVTYTGNGANATVGHGLGVAPKMVIVKNRTDTDASSTWITGHSDIGWANFLNLNTTQASTADSTVWQSTAPASSMFSVGTSVGVNESTKDFVAYCFAEVSGFSRIGTFNTNGSADNAFVYCGFRPRFILFKRTNAIENWTLWDTARDVYNVTDSFFVPNTGDAEATSANLDILSNGFKLRAAYTSGATYAFIAFAETPFNYSRAR